MFSIASNAQIRNNPCESLPAFLNGNGEFLLEMRKNQGWEFSKDYQVTPAALINFKHVFDKKKVRNFSK